MRVADFIAAVVVLLMGIGIICFSWGLPYMTEFGPGPSFLPRWIGIGLAVSATVVLMNLLRKHEKAGTFFQAKTREAAKMLGIIVVTFLLLPLLGFSIAFALFSAASMRIMGRHGWVACGLTAIGIGIGIRVVFAQWLSIPLPTGILGW